MSSIENTSHSLEGLHHFIGLQHSSQKNGISITKLLILKVERDIPWAKAERVASKEAKLVRVAFQKSHAEGAVALLSQTIPLYAAEQG